MLVGDGGAQKFTHVIVDEVHERSADMDLLLTLLKEFLYYDSGFKLILMSATMEIEFISKYFTCDNQLDTRHVKPEILEICDAERKFDKKIFYLDDLRKTMIQSKFIPQPEINSRTMEVAKTIIIEHLNRNSQNSNILVFLPGIYEIKQMQSYLKFEQRIEDSCTIMILHSEIASDMQKQTFAKCPKTKIVLCTNIAESSITIPDVSCVIDFCLTKYLVCDPNSSISRLTLAWAARNNMEQRAGRTGRTCNGEVYRLIFKSMYNSVEFKTDEVPEMQRASLESVVLMIKKMMVKNSPSFILGRAPSPPSVDRLIQAVLTLKELGGLHRFSKSGHFDNQDGEISIMGRIMASLPIDVRVSKFIVLGYMFSVLDEAIIIAAGLSTRGIFLKHSEETLETYRKKLTWANESSCDLMAILNAYTIWINKRQQEMFSGWKDELNWCKANNLSIRCLHEMLRLVEEIKGRLLDFHLEPIHGKGWY